MVVVAAVVVVFVAVASAAVIGLSGGCNSAVIITVTKRECVCVGINCA